MSTNTPEAQELLRLYKCVIDTGADVLVPFAEDKLLKTYNGNFDRFLDDKKHELFHLWDSKKLLCCACPPAGCTLTRTGRMDNWIFEKLYDDVGIELTGHIIRNSGKVVQMCLHKYVTRNIGIHELDTVALSFLLQNFATLLPNENTALVTIKRNRNNICHAHSPNCYDMTFLNTAWTELEKSLVDLTSPSYKGVMKKQIKYLRKVDLEKEEIMELLSNVEEVLQEVKSRSNNNVAYLNGMETGLRKELTNKTDCINQHTTTETSYYAAQAQQAISEKIQKTEENLHEEVKEVKKSQENSYQKIGTELHETRSDIKEVKENQEKTQVTLVEMSRTIKNLEMFVKYERPNVLVPEEACSDAMERPVLWQIATPQHWNLEAVEAILQNPLQNDDFFKIKFVKKGSLIMLTTIAASVLGDQEAFEAAVMSFLTKMIEDCDINTEMPGRVDVRLHILNANEVSMSCELPHVDLPQPNSENKTHLLNTEKIDVAFLNGDDEKEIEWLQSMSTKLKIDYDIQCSILAKDYLNGFPLQRRLGLYLSKFQAVIVTLTKENYKQYEFYITDDMPVIAVELDYLNEVSSSLRKHPFINCTTCEHIWFPRLIDNLKNKLPDHSGKALVKEKDDIVKDCEKCETLANAAVYHQIHLQKGLVEMQFILCGSIMDEAWILNFLHQLTKFTEPYIISNWQKSFVTKLTFTTSTVFFLISPNCFKCFELEHYATSLYRQKQLPVQLKIANAVVPSWSILNIGAVIDVSSMNQKEIAHEIFYSTDTIRVVPQVLSVPKVPQDFSVPKDLSPKRIYVSQSKKGLTPHLPRSIKPIRQYEEYMETVGISSSRPSPYPGIDIIGSTLEEKLTESKLDPYVYHDDGEDIERYRSLGKGRSRQADRLIAEDNGDDIERQTMSNKNIKKDDNGDSIAKQKRANKSKEKDFPGQSESRCTIQ